MRPCRELAPDLIITQALCPVCAVSYEEVAELAAELPSRPRVIALDPHTVGESLADVRTIAQATGRRDEGVALIALHRRAHRPRAPRGARRAPPPCRRARVARSGVRRRPLDAAADRVRRRRRPARPPGRAFAAARLGDGRRRRARGRHRDAVRVSTRRARLPRRCAHADRLRGLGASRVVAVDASAYFSRPGPRLVDGLELLAHILHPRARAGGARRARWSCAVC